MVFGSDWRGGDLTPKEREGHAYTVEELRMRAPIVLATRARFESPLDADACEPCKARHGAPFAEGDPVDHPDCENPNGCRCMIVVSAKP